VHPSLSIFPASASGTANLADDLTSIPTPPTSLNPAIQTSTNTNTDAAVAGAEDGEADGEADAQADPYDGYETDPPAHYPKPGKGIARTLRPESEDLQWLVDDNFEVFSHQTNYGPVATNGHDATPADTLDAMDTGEV
jgi:hypothetical protein